MGGMMVGPRMRRAVRKPAIASGLRAVLRSLVWPGLAAVAMLMALSVAPAQSQTQSPQAQQQSSTPEYSLPHISYPKRLYYREHPELIDQRLVELDREWDIERALEAHSATVGLVGTALAATVNRKWLILPALITGFLFQHAIQGWCPQLPILRRLGFRTPEEIDEERRQLMESLEDTEAMGHG